MLTYLCKYTPVELLTALGVTPQAPNSEAADFERSDRLIHPNVCSHAKMLIDALERENVGTEDETFSENACASCEGYDAARGRRELILTNCCDSIRRVWDSADLSQMNFTFMLDLPHSDSERAVRLYAAELLRLADEYETYADQRPDMARLLAAWQRAAEDWEKIRRGNSSGDPEDNGAAGETPAGRPFVAVLGARVPDGLKVRIEDGLDLPLVDLTCGGVRTLPAPPAEFAERLAAGTLPDDFLCFPALFKDSNSFAGSTVLQFGNPGRQFKADALFFTHAADILGNISVNHGNQPVQEFHNSHFRAQIPVQEGKFQTDDTAADDCDLLRQAAAGQRGCAVEHERQVDAREIDAGDSGTGSDDDIIKAHGVFTAVLVVNHDFRVTDKGCGAADHSYLVALHQ